MGHFHELSRRTNVLLGVLLVVALVASVALSIALYRGALKSTTEITLVSDRSGLLLEKGSDVKLNGVVVGRVTDLNLTGNRSHITLAMDDDQVPNIPDNVTATIDPTTLLGRKFVTLVTPTDPSPRSLHDGEVLIANEVTTEVDDLLASLVRVLKQVDPQKVTTTTNNLSTALAGTGDRVGTLVDQLDDYLAEFNPLIGQLRSDLVSVSHVSERLADAAPDLLSTVNNLTTTSQTLTRNEKQFTAFVLSFTDFGQAGHDFFAKGGLPLERAAKSLRNPLGLLGEFSPILPCFLANLAQSNRYLERTVGGSDRPGLNITGTLLMGNPPYTYPDNLPKVGTPNTGASCREQSGPVHSHFAFDDGSDAYHATKGIDDLIGNPLATMLFGGES
ncbi:MCE family protein [Gordonia aichiensis]|uniref:Mce family protein n=1 Tax=Gordonia aichiensis NBRC 108223 TaxID=1220583 RepID=L7KN85_9ACTN|nr:MCE family protein [Gordonia aichiensis]GAC49163.1 Mce family protein [Gordonia aichiensis NBRC 108223]